MDARLIMALGVFLVALILGTSAKSIQEVSDLDDQDPGNDIDVERRATWLETKSLEDDFKELTNLALVELAKEGRLSKDIFTVSESEKTKRGGRWQGFCFRRTRSGRFLPYICWKGEQGAQGKK